MEIQGPIPQYSFKGAFVSFLLFSVVEPEPEPQELKLFAVAEPERGLECITIPDPELDTDPT
jgi:hypothetical protein